MMIITESFNKALVKLGNIVGQHSQIPNVAQMLSSLATVSADKFIKTFVARMFENAQTFFGNIFWSPLKLYSYCFRETKDSAEVQDDQDQMDR